MKKTILSVFALVFYAHISNAQVIVTVVPSEPVIKVIAPEKPTPKHVWVDGFWVWNKRLHQYVWRDGYWIVPKRGHYWVPGHWDKVPAGHRWVPGHWSR